MALEPLDVDLPSVRRLIVVHDTSPLAAAPEVEIWPVLFKQSARPPAFPFRLLTQPAAM